LQIKKQKTKKNESNTIRVLRPGDDVTIYNKTTAVRTYDCSYQNITITGLDGDGVRRTISRTLTDLKAGDTIFCQFDITNGEAVKPFPDEYYFVIENITVTYDTVENR